jgi:hypothetical protein
VVPVRAALSRRLPSLPELRAVALTATGLGVFLVASQPSPSMHAEVGGQAAAFAGVGAGLALLCGGCARASRVPSRRAFLLGMAAGMLFGLVAGLLKLSIQELADGGMIRMLTIWPTWVVLVAGICGVLTNQLAYRTAHLSASMPVLNIVDGMGALAAGYIIFHEVPRTTPFWLTVEIGALISVAIGLRLIALLDESSVATTDVDRTAAEVS